MISVGTGGYCTDLWLGNMGRYLCLATEALEFNLFQNLFCGTCEDECFSLGHGYFGYEYYSSGRCEVWKVHTKQTELEYKDSHDCYIRVNIKKQEADIQIS